MFRTYKRPIGDVMMIDLKGTIRTGKPEETIRRTVNALVEQGHRKILLNLVDVSSSDTTGISAVLEAAMTVRACGGDLRVARLIEGVQSIPIIMAVCRYVPVFDSVEEAIVSFRSWAPEESTVRETVAPVSEVAAV